MLQSLPMVTKGPGPLAVAEASLDIMSSESPKFRYMVVDQPGQADATIRRAMTEMLQLNHQQPHTFGLEKLTSILQEEQQKLIGLSEAPKPWFSVPDAEQNIVDGSKGNIKFDL